MIGVGIINATITETTIQVNGSLGATLILTCDSDSANSLLISVNDNLHYQAYKPGEIIPLSDRSNSFYQLYVKTSSGTGTGRYWVTG